jgi:putative ABC transport system ATP-binding protein
LAKVEVRQVCKDYGQDQVKVAALQNVNLQIGQGEFTVLAGPSGSGKTTLLNLMGCLDQPTSGEIVIDGVNIGNMDNKAQADFRREKLGFIFQSYNLIPVLTAFENVEFPLTLVKKYAKAEQAERVNQILTEVGLAGLAHRRPAQLSGGQQQRVAIARALIKEPAVILADEPTANLDSATGESILNIMKELNQKQQVTFIFSSHDRMVIEYAKRVIHLRDGKVESEESREK